MKSTILRVVLALWFAAAVALVLSGNTPVSGQQGKIARYLPLMAARAPFQADPALRDYLGLVVVDEVYEDLELYTVRGDGSQWHRLTDNEGDEFHATWSPNNSKIAFAGYDPQISNRIMVVNVDGSGLRPAMNAPEPGGIGGIKWSPRGDQLLLRFVVVTSPLREVLVIVEPNGSHRTIVDVPLDPVGPWGWSPDGRNVHYSAAGANEDELWVWSVATGSGTRVATFGARAGFNSQAVLWHPDGERLVYHFPADTEGEYEVRVVGADGSDPRELLTGPQTGAAWLLGGEQLLLVEHASGEGPLNTIPFVGGAVTPLSGGDAILGGVAPDGASLLYWLTASNTLVLHAAGGAPRTLPDAPCPPSAECRLYAGSATWAYDGSEITYAIEETANDSSAQTLRVQRLSEEGPGPIFGRSGWLLPRYLPFSSARVMVNARAPYPTYTDDIWSAYTRNGTVTPLPPADSRTRYFLDWRHLP